MDSSVKKCQLNSVMLSVMLLSGMGSIVFIMVVWLKFHNGTDAVMVNITFNP